MSQLPPVTKNLLIINVLMFLAQYVFEYSLGIDLAALLGLHFFKAEDFALWQMITYLFLHGDFMHLFFNMFSLWMFGRIIEQVLGERRFLVYYFVCGIGAALCQELWQYIEFLSLGLSDYELVNLGIDGIISVQEYLNHWTTIGASGACYGVLLAFGFMFPNERIVLMIPPIPMKAKYFVVAYAAIELFAAFNSNSNIAHFAHLGGMLFGWLLLLKWRKDSRGNSGRFRGWDNWQARRKKSFAERLKDWFKPARKNDGYDRGGSFKDREADYDYNLRQRQEQEHVDRILEKIKRSGYESLTEEEKQDLFRHSRK